jgi:Peptidase C13 family
VHFTNSGFAEMVMYIEACESGSIFEGTLDDSLKIYAVVRDAAHLRPVADSDPMCQPSPALTLAPESRN